MYIYMYLYVLMLGHLFYDYFEMGTKPMGELEALSFCLFGGEGRGGDGACSVIICKNKCLNFNFSKFNVILICKCV